MYIIGVIHVGPSSSTTVATSFSCIDFSLSTPTKTCFDKCAKLVDAILLRASAFLFLLLAKPLIMLLAFSSPAPDPSTHDDPFVNSVHGSYGVSITDASGGVSSGFSTRKSARIWSFTDVYGRHVILCSPSMMLYFCNRHATSGRDITCLMGWSVMTTMGCAWKYLCNLLAAQTSARTSFFIGVLKSGKDFSADLEMNLFRLASFPLRLWTYLIVRGDGSCNTASVLSGHGFIPFGFIMYPRNIPSAVPNVYF
nr:hypothetical protein [Tanacetum cinerariifolium]